MLRSLSFVALVLSAFVVGDDTDADRKQAAQKERLTKLQPLVGSWRGVGQPQRASTKDSWIEEADWAWSFGTSGPALVAKLPKGKYFSELRLMATDGDALVLTATPAAGGEA